MRERRYLDRNDFSDAPWDAPVPDTPTRSPRPTVWVVVWVCRWENSCARSTMEGETKRLRRVAGERDRGTR